MLNHEEQLRTYLQSPGRKRSGLTVLQLRISLIEDKLRKDSILNTILSSFYETLAPYGQAFCLKNDDIFIAYTEQVGENTIKAALIRTWMYFSADGKTADPESLQTVYHLPADHTALFHEFVRIDNGPTRMISEPEEVEHKKKKIMPVMPEKNQKLLTPAELARVSKALLNTDFSNMMRRQSVCIILDESQPQPLFEEVFVSIAELSESILPGISLTATPWLFQDLTETLDKRVLSSISRHDDGAFTRDFSVNLNVSTILSEEFRAFDDNIRSNMKSSIVLELQALDIFSDLRSYLMARDYAQNLGYKVCIDGITERTLRLVDRERLGADYMKLTWNPELPDALREEPELQDKLLNIGANRAILCRVDDENALKVAQEYNITLFQGHYIQYLISKNSRTRRAGVPVYRRY